MKGPRRETLRAYGESVLRVWVVFVILLGLYVLGAWLSSIVSESWQWFVVMSVFATMVGIVMEFLMKRRK